MVIYYKITTVLKLLINMLIKRKHYTLTFDKDDSGAWFYRFKNWGFDYNNLLMVSGADELCECLSNGKNTLTVDIIASKKPIKVPDGYYEYKGEDMSSFSFDERYFYGRYYKSKTPINNLKTFWICPVTLFVLGRYPNYIYINGLTNNG